jgi:hypothetical protein
MVSTASGAVLPSRAGERVTKTRKKVAGLWAVKKTPYVPSLVFFVATIPVLLY